jgi:Restriction endonuclease
MAPSLKQSQAIAEIAGVLYRFLPGSGSRSWKGHITFGSIAEDLGISQFWPGGSKEPAIVSLLESTLECRPDLLEKLILRIVRSGIRYCKKDPITREEIEELNGLILHVGFKFPDLWDETFLGSLNLDPKTRSEQSVAEERLQERVRFDQSKTRQDRLQELNGWFLDIHGMADRQKAGLVFQDFLNGLFDLESLDPREPFTIKPQLEQIDGSFSLDNETYLVEAKWQRDQIQREPLSAFRDVVTGKSHFTRGVFISMSGCTPNAIEALTRGKQPVFFILDGYHLMTALQGTVTLTELLRHYVRRFAEEGLMYVAANELIG